MYVWHRTIVCDILAGKRMGTQGFYSAEGTPLSRRDLATLPKDTVIRCHTHAQHTDGSIARMIRSAEKHHGTANVLPKRAASLGKGILVTPNEHGDMFIATDYIITLTSDPLTVRSNFGTAKPEFHGGRKKRIPREITWLTAPKERPRAPSNRSLRRLKRSDWFK